MLVKPELCQRMTVHPDNKSDRNLRFLNASKHIHKCSNGHFKISPIYIKFWIVVIIQEKFNKTY